jgi:hypothetical protein
LVFCRKKIKHVQIYGEADDTEGDDKLRLMTAERMTPKVMTAERMTAKPMTLRDDRSG